MEREQTINSHEIEKDPMVKLATQEFESGMKSYLVYVNPKFIQECYENDRSWDVDFRNNVGPNYPYTMSPKTSELIASVSSELKNEMSRVGFQIDPWKIGADEEPYVMGVLRRVMVTDTIEPIIGYTDEIVKYLETVKEKNPSKVLSIRSFFCGAAVADKCLMTRLAERGLSANLTTTDIAADSIAIAALNFSVWNELLPENDKYEIHIIKGSVPPELVSRDKTIVLQVEDAIAASEEEAKLPLKFDALLLDNGLQYVSREFTEKLIDNVVKNVGDYGLYIGALGLDSHIKVEIPPIYHLRQIIDSRMRDLRKVYEKKAEFKAPYDYAHKYHFNVNEKTGMILIDRVVSDGAARMYTWLGKLLNSNKKRFSEVMGAIKSATELSKANKVVETTPFDYHNVMVKTIDTNGLTQQILEVPLEYEKFGWKKVGEDLYENGQERVDGGTMMKICKEKDPLVLRRSRIYIEPKK
ncbi:hypothetical protein KBB42_00280 [Candidatus Dojkabacteria bacterium]|nr:hypothetical protein [Candidatus Dojkabacteria bacterium]